MYPDEDEYVVQVMPYKLISEKNLAILRRKQQLIEYQQEILTTLQESFIRLLQDEYDIDPKEEDWVLDLDAGVLTRNEQDR